MEISLQGIEEMVELAKKLKSENIEKIFHSPFVRTTQSAEILSKVLKVEMISDERFIESSYHEKTLEQFSESYQIYKKGVLEILNKHTKAIIVSHEFPMGLFLSKELGNSLDKIMENHKLTKLLRMGDCIKADFEDYSLKNTEFF